MHPPEQDSPGPDDEPRYGDFLLVDLLRPDFKHFFSRYRVDIIGFVILTTVVVFIIWATRWLAMIGAGAAVGAVQGAGQ